MQILVTVSRFNKQISNHLTILNSFLANVPILYSLKTPENQRFSGVFRGYKTGTLVRNRLKYIYIYNYKFDCSDKCFIFLLTCQKCLKQYVGRTVDKFRLRWNNYKNNSCPSSKMKTNNFVITIVKINACKNHCIKNEVFH